MLVENATSPWGQSWEWVFNKHSCIQFIALVALDCPHGEIRHSQDCPRGEIRQLHIPFHIFINKKSLFGIKKMTIATD